MPAKKKTATKRRGRPPKVGQGLREDVPKKGTIVPNSGAISVRPDDGIDLTTDLREEERAQFARLLKQKMSLEERATQLVELAKLTDTKRAPVGLRAIQEINAITGVHDPKPQESPAMFVFPEDTQVSIHVEKVVK